MKHIAILLLAAPLLAAAQTYNLAADFSATKNSGQAWQYGWSANLGQSFEPYGSSTKISGVDYWSDGLSANLAPSVSHNPTGASVVVDDHVLAPGAAAFEPGPYGGLSIVRWVAPQSGLYHLDASFIGLGSRSTAQVYVTARGGAQAFYGEMRGPGSTQSFSGNLPVGAGGGFDFIVSNMGSGSGGNTIGISAQLTMVPEPASALTLFAGLAVLAVTWARRGRAGDLAASR